MKPQRVYAQIDLEAICHNVRESMKKVGPDVKSMAVVKADAYGHGAVQVAQMLSGIGVYGFAVATVEEGVELRTSGLEKPILVLGHVFPDEWKRAISHDIAMPVSSYELAAQIDKAAHELDTPAKIHVAVDTGMGRIGFQPNEESVEEIKRIFTLKDIEPEGVFTHFACADCADKTSRNRQIAKFLDFTQKLSRAGCHFPIRHMCNSATVMEGTDDYLDMVRLGITIYGLLPSDEVNPANLDLRPAMSLVSHIAHLKTVGPGFTVGYGSTYTTTKPETTIATIPVGYADGYPRLLSNKGYVLIQGKHCPIVGRVCMDQFMADVSDLEDVQIGDEVVLIGRQGDDEIRVEDLSALCGRFNYEFVCDINKRVPRVYKH